MHANAIAPQSAFPQSYRKMQTHTGLPLSQVQPELCRVLVSSLLWKLCWTHSAHDLKKIILNTRQQDAFWSWKLLEALWGWGPVSHPEAMSTSSCEVATPGQQQTSRGTMCRDRLVVRPTDHSQISSAKTCEAPAAEPGRIGSSKGTGVQEGHGIQERRRWLRVLQARECSQDMISTLTHDPESLHGRPGELGEKNKSLKGRSMQSYQQWLHL